MYDDRPQVPDNDSSPAQKERLEPRSATSFFQHAM
jgi:hypothetical protein